MHLNDFIKLFIGVFSTWQHRSRNSRHFSSTTDPQKRRSVYPRYFSKNSFL
jgi:hypothetical protein